MFFYDLFHCRKLTGRTWQPRRCLPRSSRWFGMSWMSATLQRSSQRWTPPTRLRPCLRTVTASSRWGAQGRSDNRAVFVVNRQERSSVLPAGYCTGRHWYLHWCWCLSGFWLQAVWNVDTCGEKKKSHNTFSTFCLRLFFEILHSNWSNQVKFWMSSKGCCKSTRVCLCAAVFRSTKGSFIGVIAAICSSHWRNRCEWLFLM